MDARFIVRLTPLPASALTVNIALSGAESFVDESTLPTTVTFMPGARPVLPRVDIPIIDDDVDEMDGVLTLTVEEGDGYTVGDPSSDMATILDDDDPAPELPEVTIAAVTSSITEGASARYTLTAAPAPDEALTVHIKATGADDFVPDTPPTMATILADETTASVEIRTDDDATEEPDADLTVTVQSGEDYLYTVGDPSSAMVTIKDNDDPSVTPVVTVEVAPTRTSVTEGEGVDARFIVWLNPLPASELTVNIALSGAESFVDDSALPTTATFRPGEPPPRVDVPIIDDDIDEMNGVLTLTVESGDGYTVGDPSNDMATILDDDDPAPELPEVTIEAGDSPVTEGMPATFTVRASLAPTAALTVNLAASGADGLVGTPPTSTVIAAGETSVTVSVATIDDEVDEANGDLTVEVVAGAGYTVGNPSSAVVTINDDDDTTPEPAPTVTIEAGDSPVTEGTPATFTVRATPAPTAALTVNLAASGADDLVGTPPTSTVIAAGEASVTVSVGTLDDEVDEANGDLTVTLRSGTGYTVGNPSSAVVTINDDDDDTTPEPDPVVTITGPGGPVTEGGVAVFTVTATPAPAAALTVNVAATGADSFVEDRPETVTVGTAGTGTVSVATVDDEMDEPDAELTVTLRSGAGYTVGDPSSAMVAINDDDLTPVPALTVLAQLLLAAFLAIGGCRRYLRR